MLIFREEISNDLSSFIPIRVTGQPCRILKIPRTASADV
jgi:hypothetical protein